MKWIWVRHGETEANAHRRYLGHADSPLTAAGLKQAEKAAVRLKETGATRLFTSDLGRCEKTAEVIGRSVGLVSTPVRDLRELDFGDWDGSTYEEIVASDRELTDRWYGNPFDVSPPGGETLRELGERVDRSIERIMPEVHASATVIVVTHGGPIRWFWSKHVLGDQSQFWKVEGVSPGEQATAEFVDGKWKIIE